MKEIEEKYQIALNDRSESKMTLWLPKVFCIFSHYLFHDKYVKLIEKILSLMHQPQGAQNLLEALVFELVCKIEFPVNETINYREIKVSSSLTSNSKKNAALPYISDSFFNTLLNKVDVETIIQVFTHLLCEERIILVAQD